METGGKVVVDEAERTSVANVYAVGDVAQVYTVCHLKPYSRMHAQTFCVQISLLTIHFYEF